MYHSQNVKTIALAPTSIASNATATLIVDTKGFAEAQFVLLPGTTNTVSNNFATLRLDEGDTTSSFGAVPGYVGGTNSADGFTIPINQVTSATAANPYVFNVDLRGRKRYLRLTATPKTAVLIGGLCNLHRPATSPDSIAEAAAAGGADGVAVGATTTLGLVVNPGGPLT